jgi:AraC-like DNA-binding protein
MLIQRDVAAVYARLLLQYAMQRGLLDEQSLLVGTDLTPEILASEDYISWPQLAAVIRNCRRTQDSVAWAAEMGRQFGIAPHGALGFAALSAPTLGSALEAITELMAVRISAIGLSLERKDGRYTLRLFDRSEDADVFNEVCELTIKNIETLVTTLFGHGLLQAPAGAGQLNPNSPEREAIIYLARTRPDDEGPWMAVFESRLVFDAGQNALSIPVDWWQLASPLYDELNYRGNLSKCRDLFIARQQQASVAHRVSALLKQHFEQQIAGRSASAELPGLRAVANVMHLSPRTLTRRLQVEGQSYNDILRDVRREYARSLLRDARLSVAEVGEYLGFHEPANFARAFRSWFGTSPAAWRRSGA